MQSKVKTRAIVYLEKVDTAMEYFPIMLEEDFEQTYPEIHREVCEVLGMGFVPNIFRCLTNVSPELALASWGMVKNNLCSGELSRVSKEILFSYIAFKRNCQYCHVAHHAMALKFGHDDQDIIEIVNDIESVRNPVLKSVLQFADVCMAHDFNASVEMYEDLEDIGLEKEEIIELIGMVSCSLYMVNLADSLSVDIDKRFTDYTENAA